MSASSGLSAAGSIYDSVLQEWTDERLPRTFVKMFPVTRVAMRDLTAAVIREAKVERGQHILDIACGAGTPTLELAVAVGPHGHVTATDPSPILLDAARENARAEGLTNITFVQAAASQLPFEPATFDAATCQLGVMFFPDLDASLRRIRNVLKPGARVSFIAWGPPAENRFFGTFGMVLANYLPGAPAEPPPDTPSPGRFAKPGSLSAALDQAGFAAVREEAVPFYVRNPTAGEVLVDNHLEVSGAGEKLPAEKLGAFRNEAAAAYEQFRLGDELQIPVTMVVASGEA